MNLKKFKALVAEHWVPALITGVFGLALGLSVTLFEAQVSDNRFFLEKQAATADRVAQEFSKYVENWRRIMELKKHVSGEKRNPSAEELEQLKTYVVDRNAARDRLFSALDALHLYFKNETSIRAMQFRSWDEQQSTKTVADLPAISEWQARERALLSAMRKELMK